MRRSLPSAALAGLALCGLLASAVAKGPSIPGDAALPPRPPDAKLSTQEGILRRHAVRAQAGTLTLRTARGREDIFRFGLPVRINWRDVACKASPSGVPAEPDTCPDWPANFAVGYTRARVGYWQVKLSIDRWVLSEACRQAALLPPHVVISVNIWAGWFPLGQLAEVVQRSLAASGIDPARLEIEITESVLAENNAATLQQMHTLKALSVKLALDDFAGPATPRSATYLLFRSTPSSWNRSLVRDLCMNSRSRTVATAVLRLGHQLGMEVCAESVETPEQVATLREDEYDWIQGYLIGRPAPLPIARMWRPEIVGVFGPQPGY